MKQPHWLSLLIIALLPLSTPAQTPKTITVKTVDRVLIEKSKRLMTLYYGDRIVRSYRVALGKVPVGRKEREGDFKTPEGIYFVINRNEHSKFYRSLWISYPNALDEMRANKLGVSPGGAIMIHGLPNDRSVVGKYHHKVDWTEGCIAVTNEEMDEIWQWVEDGTVVEIVP